MIGTWRLNPTVDQPGFCWQKKENPNKGWKKSLQNQEKSLELENIWNYRPETVHDKSTFTQTQMENNRQTKTKGDEDYFNTWGSWTQVRTIKGSAVNETQVADIKKQTQEEKLKMLPTEYTNFTSTQEIHRTDTDIETGT